MIEYECARGITMNWKRGLGLNEALCGMQSNYDRSDLT
jgi:hypothetical protein